MKYTEDFKKKAQELYPEPEVAYLHRWINLGFTEPVGEVLKCLAIGPIQSNSNSSIKERLSRQLDEKEKLYQYWQKLAGKSTS